MGALVTLGSIAVAGVVASPFLARAAERIREIHRSL